jgi:hypothetical protein
MQIVHEQRAEIAHTNGKKLVSFRHIQAAIFGRHGNCPSAAYWAIGTRLSFETKMLSSQRNVPWR